MNAAIIKRNTAQVATIKRQLQLLLPGVSVFLDVDDLVEIGDLEGYIEASQCIMIFLSKGYFFSRNCLRELNHSVLTAKPLVLVHEVDPGKGGAPIETMISDCPEDMRDAVFGGKAHPERDIIVWHRISDFQLISLKMIAARLLHATPKFSSGPRPVLYVPNEISRLSLGFRKHTLLFVSQNNPGDKLSSPPSRCSHTRKVPSPRVGSVMFYINVLRMGRAVT